VKPRAHATAECDRLLRADPSFDAFLCRPALWMCECGRAWAHVCDEAEGCFWARMPGNDAAEATA
jgi:hypothetical protein